MVKRQAIVKMERRYEPGFVARDPNREMRIAGGGEDGEYRISNKEFRMSKYT